MIKFREPLNYIFFTKKFRFFNFFYPSIFLKIFYKKGAGSMLKKKILHHYYNIYNNSDFFFFEFIDNFLINKKYTVSFHQTKKTTYINHKKKYLYSVDFSFIKKNKSFFFLKFSKYFFFKKKFIKSLFNFF